VMTGVRRVGLSSLMGIIARLHHAHAGPSGHGFLPSG
jgi:hypothetical protein